MEGVRDLTWLILLHEDAPVDPRVHGEVVARELGMSLLEAKMAVRRGRGILFENLPEAAARAIAADLEKAGVRATVVEKPEMPSPRRVGRAQRGEASFEYLVAGTDERGAVPWDAIAIVSVGLVAREAGHFDHVQFEGLPAFRKVDRPEDREVLRENLILRIGNAPRKEPGRADKGKSPFERIDPKRLRVFADVVTEDFGTWLRLSMDEFGYVLTEGAVALGSPWGLESFVDDLRKRCAAAFTDLTLQALAADDPTPLVFAQLEELNRHTTWAILRKQLGLEPPIPWAELDGPG